MPHQQGILMIAASLLAFAFILAALFFVVARRHGNARYFRDQAFHFQTLRVLNYLRADGSDTAEVLETIRHIREGDMQGWYRAWEATASRVHERAQHINDRRSRGQALLRAHNYLRAAEFFLAPGDARRGATFARNVAAFDAGLAALNIDHERMRFACGPDQLSAIFYPGPPGAETLPLLVFCGGFDSTLEELYFALVPAAHQRGYSVLTYEGPGQGGALRVQKLVFTAEWERPTSALLDAFLSAHPQPVKTVLIGMSMGGYLAPRAAAFDQRIDGVVAFDVLFDFGAIAQKNVPRLAFWLDGLGANAVLDALIAVKTRISPGFAWAIANAQWVLGTSSAIRTVEALRAYTLAPVANRIRADVLILAGAADHFVPVEQVRDFVAALTGARSVRSIVYDAASGGAEHCQLGAQSLWHADLFDWLEQVFSAIPR
jgi:alpha-beta hydrolase superfamily lysophospholipase